MIQLIHPEILPGEVNGYRRITGFMKTRTLSLTGLLVLAMFVLNACSAAGLPALTTAPKQQPGLVAATQAPALPATTQSAAPAAAVQPVVSNDLLAAYQGTLENLYAAVSPSVVNIQVVEKVGLSSQDPSQMPGFPFFNLPPGHPQVPQDQQPQTPQQPQDQFQSALGSGFVWDQNGHIVTNNHVVSGADKIEVTFSDGTTVPAKLVGADPDSDLAVIKVDVAADKLRPVQMADSSAIKVGQMAVAIGNPFGLEGTMTTGIISAVGRSLPADENSAQSYTIPDVIQTDAAINPGNSGGVLVDAQGQVLGVTSAIESPVRANAGVGFAIPATIVKNVVPALITDGKYVHSWLGISGGNLMPDLATAMNLDAGQRGAIVGEVFPNSPAEKAGLQGSSKDATIDGQPVKVGGDVITAIDGRPINAMDDLIAYLVSSTKVGQNVTLTILRDGKQQTLDVTLAPRPSAEERNQAALSTAPAASQGVRLGIQGLTVDENVVKEMNLPSGQQGVLVVEVQPGSLADKAGLQGGSKSVTINGQDVMVGGDIITAVNGQAVASIQELKAALSQLPTDQSLTLTVLRNGTETEVTVQPGM
jgi:serine protease Do